MPHPSRLQEISLDELRPNPDQPRKTFDEDALNELADSIARNGLIQPIVAVKDGDGFTIVAGERRFRAVRALRWEKVPALLIEDGMTDELALIENVQREDLHPLEEADAMQRLMDRHGYSQKELAKVIGKARPTVVNTLKLNELPELIKDQCTMSYVVPKSVLLEIVRLPAKERLGFWEEVKRGGLTVKKVRARRSRKRRRSGRGALALAVLAGERLRERLRAVDPEHDDISPEHMKRLADIHREIDELLQSLAGS